VVLSFVGTATCARGDGVALGALLSGPGAGGRASRCGFHTAILVLLVVAAQGEGLTDSSFLGSFLFSFFFFFGLCFAGALLLLLKDNLTGRLRARTREREVLRGTLPPPFF
jgi:hypothetical protein